MRLLFDYRVSLQHSQLRFDEPNRERMQELRFDGRLRSEGAARDIVCQQWNFKPVGSRVEVEDYR
jgi:hypothetical protein